MGTGAVDYGKYLEREDRIGSITLRGENWSSRFPNPIPSVRGERLRLIHSIRYGDGYIH